MNLHDYVVVLKQSKGVVPEFINPKYADETKSKFKKPARVESLMQDFAQLFESDKYNVGGVVFDRYTYQPVKNMLSDGLDKIAHGASGYCAGTGEGDFYELARRRCVGLGVHITT
uniref:UDP-sugar pyrophospharylase n=1 Tax=Lygus hesperus TaxID=30085 RepID=A0A0A9XLY3_LYGHE